MSDSTHLVVARFNEDLSWLSKVSDTFQIIVYNKGLPVDIPARTKLPIKVRNLANLGRETDTYLMYIIENYENFPDRIIFTQGDPFPHSPKFLDLLESTESWQPYQPLTLYYMQDCIPPKKVMNDNQSCFTRPETFMLRSLQPSTFEDSALNRIATEYRRNCQCEVSIMHQFFGDIGLSRWLPESAELGSFAYGAIFGVRRDLILQHSVAIYQQMLQYNLAHWSVGYVAERAWWLMFDKEESMSIAVQTKGVCSLKDNPQCCLNLKKRCRGTLHVVDKSTTVIIKPNTQLKM